MKKLTFTELKDYFYEYNKKGCNGICKTNPNIKKAVIVFSDDSFYEYCSLKERSYVVRSDANAFVSGIISNAIFADCLDGVDLHIRLDLYMEYEDWKIDYCYLLD